MRKYFVLILLIIPFLAFSQNKKPLTHDVYDGWKSLGERKISKDGKYVLYAVNPQQGDGTLYFQNTADTSQKIILPRGYDAVFGNNNQFAVAKIKAKYEDTRQARIKKKKPDEMPKDSLAIIYLTQDSIKKIAKVKSYKIPEKQGDWLAYQLDFSSLDSLKKSVKKSDTIQLLAKISDSIIKKSIDSIKGKISKEKIIAVANKAAKEIYKNTTKDLLIEDAEDDGKPDAAKSSAGDLVLLNMATGSKKMFPLVTEYYFNKLGNTLLIKTAKNAKDSLSKAYVLIHQLATEKTDTILSKFNDAKNFASDENGMQWAFVAERDSSEKSLQKFYKLWYYTQGSDSAKLLVNKSTKGMLKGYTVSENANLLFSKDGQKLFFGTASIQPPKDTTIVDFETARLDIWHYNDDYIQPQQLKQLSQESKRSFTAVMTPKTDTAFIQLGSPDVENITIVNEGNADWVLGQTTKGYRIASNWEGRAKNAAYYINCKTGEKKKIQEGVYTIYLASPNGKYAYWYNPEKKAYFAYDIASKKTQNISTGITQPIYDIENDVPDLPRNMGISGWMANDEAILIDGYYDIFKIHLNNTKTPINLTQFGKTKNQKFNYGRLDPEKRFIDDTDTLYFVSQNITNKTWNVYLLPPTSKQPIPILSSQKNSFANVLKAKNTNMFVVQKANIQSSELYVGTDFNSLKQLTNIALQQDSLNWLTSELVRWKMFDGKMSEGILYKPENFDPKKKYPVIFYFYEKNADDLYMYRQPAPSASTINIPYFVSNEYIVFDPNIYYKTGQPGESAYNSVVSAAKHLAKMPWIDSTRMGIQGQSWGGYQVAYLITRTNMFRAAGAGAPVSNMTSAYGGIRWGSGLVRQFQYEKQQSRIGATLWQRPDLYIKNSPLFHADKVNTPLLIMHNDADGAVPWYQGIEYYSALRRLGKKVWMLQYNGEDHNLMERRNRKDLSIRLAQFFDYHLKGAKPAKWIATGLPATEKGRSWGIEIN